MDDKDLRNYLTSMAIGHILMRKKLLHMNEFLEFEKRMMIKYRIDTKSLYLDYYTIVPFCKDSKWEEERIDDVVYPTSQNKEWSGYKHHLFCNIGFVLHCPLHDKEKASGCSTPILVAI